MSYRLEQVDEAEARIRAECPTAIVQCLDYDLALSVAPANKSFGLIVFRPERPHQSEVIGDLDKIISRLNAEV